MIISLIILAGGYIGSHDVNSDTILEYDIIGNSYTQIGTMAQGRGLHAISVVNYEDYSKWCE